MRHENRSFKYKRTRELLVSTPMREVSVVVFVYQTVGQLATTLPPFALVHPAVIGSFRLTVQNPDKGLNINMIIVRGKNKGKIHSGY